MHKTSTVRRRTSASNNRDGFLLEKPCSFLLAYHIPELLSFLLVDFCFVVFVLSIYNFGCHYMNRTCMSGEDSVANLTTVSTCRLRLVRGMESKAGIEDMTLNHSDVNELPAPLACAPAPICCIFSPTFLLTSKNLATQRSTQTLSPLLSSASVKRVPIHFV